ncbi:hypothetical protein OSTOST_03656, partial [Ostertagia ostertagi]
MALWIPVSLALNSVNKWEYLSIVPILFVMTRLLILRRRLHPFHYLILSKLAADAIEILLPMMTFSASQLLFFTFDAQLRQFTFSDQQCGRALSLYQDLIYNVTLAVVSTFADIYCLLKLNYYRKTAAKIALLYVLMLVSFHIAESFEGVTSRFILTVIAWQIWLGST